MAAVAGASPVTITVRTPSARSSATSAAESARGGSLSAISPDQLHRRRRSGGDRQHAKSLAPPARSPPPPRSATAAPRPTITAKAPLTMRCSRTARVRSARSPRTSSSPDRTARIVTSFGASATAFAAAAARIAPSTGSCPPSELASAASASTCASSKPGIGTNARHRQRVAGQRAGLVGAQHIHRRRFIHRGQAGRQHAQLRQGARAERRRQREGGGQCDRYRRQHRGQDQRNDLGDRHPRSTGIGHQQRR